MPISFTCDHEKKFLETTAREILSCRDVLEHIDAKEAIGALHYKELFDARGVTLDLSLAELHRIADRMRTALGGQKYARVAVVTNNSFIYGLARTYGEMTSQENPEFGVFQDLPEARSWIGGEAADSAQAAVRN